MLMDEISELKSMINREPERRLPIGIKEAAKILGKAVQTVYSYTCKNTIPHYRQNGKLYFYEDELVNYIESGKKGVVSK